MIIRRDDAYVRFWQRNRPGDREELDGNSVATLRSMILDYEVTDEMNRFELIMINTPFFLLNSSENWVYLVLLMVSD